METFKHSNEASKKAIIKLLLSVSAFSVIMLSYSSLLVPFLLNSLYDVYLYAFHFHKQSFSPALEKNFVFLLCNGLLVIIVKNSGLSLVENKPLDAKQTTPIKNSVPLEHVVLEEEEEEKFGVSVRREEELVIVEMDEREKTGSGFIVVEDCDNENDDDDDDDEDEEEEEEAIVELPSAEEFNKKCEDFIRRVKEEIKLGGL